MRHILGLVGTVIALMGSTPALAWSEETHQTIGEIAYDQLAAQQPERLAELMALVHLHPHYAQLLARTAGLSGTARDRAVFGWLARWPDDIRNTAADRPKWHYELRVVHGRTSLWPFRNGTAQYAFDGNAALLANRAAPPAHRAVAIGWLLHIIGDIQQPLHAGHQMTSDFAQTDEAGGLAWVRRSAGGELTNLHQYWDKFLERNVPASETAGTTWHARLTAQFPRARLRELRPITAPNRAFATWLDESLLIAQRVAYRGSFLAASPAPSRAPVVSAADSARARAVTERRVTLGGYRAADVLAHTMGSAH